MMKQRVVVIKALYGDDSSVFPTEFVTEHTCPKCGLVFRMKEPFIISPWEWEEVQQDGYTFNVNCIEGSDSWWCENCCQEEAQKQQQRTIPHRQEDDDWLPF